MLLALGLAGGYIFAFGPQSFTFLYEKWVGFVTASVLMSVLQALYVYWASHRGEKQLALGGNSGNPIYDVSLFRICLARSTLTLSIVLYRS